MFKQQRKAAGYVPYHQLGLLKLKLSQAGYENHDGPKVQREGEVLAARATFDGRDGVRQNHVQVVDRGTVLAVYAHTEPHAAYRAAPRSCDLGIERRRELRGRLQDAEE